MDKKIYDDEIEMKKELAKFGFYYGELGSNSEFVVIFRDNKSFAPILRGVFTSPIEAVRKIGDIIQTIKLPIEDLDLQLAIVYDLTKEKIHLFSDYTVLSPYLYFKKKEVNGNEVLQAAEQAENENTDSN